MFSNEHSADEHSADELLSEGAASRLSIEEPERAEDYARDERVLSTLRAAREQSSESMPVLVGFADAIMGQVERERDMLQPAGPAAPLPHGQRPALEGDSPAGTLISLRGLWQPLLVAAAAALLTAGLNLALPTGEQPDSSPVATQDEPSQPTTEDAPVLADADDDSSTRSELPELASQQPRVVPALETVPAPRRRVRDATPRPQRRIQQASGGRSGGSRGGPSVEELEELFESGLRRMFQPRADEGDEVRF